MSCSAASEGQQQPQAARVMELHCHPLALRKHAHEFLSMEKKKTQETSVDSDDFLLASVGSVNELLAL